MIVTFFDSDSIIDQYLVNVKRKFITGNAKTEIKCCFSFVNVQHDIGLGSVRYWATNAQTAQYFNVFVHFSLARGTKKIIIINTETGSAWRFLRFNSLTPKVLFNNSFARK